VASTNSFDRFVSPAFHTVICWGGAEATRRQDADLHLLYRRILAMCVQAAHSRRTAQSRPHVTADAIRCIANNLIWGLPRRRSQLSHSRSRWKRPPIEQIIHDRLAISDQIASTPLVQSWKRQHADRTIDAARGQRFFIRADSHDAKAVGWLTEQDSALTRCQVPKSHARVSLLTGLIKH